MIFSHWGKKEQIAIGGLYHMFAFAPSSLVYYRWKLKKPDDFVKKAFDATARGCYTLCGQLYGFATSFR
jgi:hypothetical protein